MNRVHALLFALRGALIRRQLARLKHSVTARPHAASAHLVPCYPRDPMHAPVDHQPGRLAPWFCIAALITAFLAGCVAAADSRTAAIEVSPLMCSITLHGDDARALPPPSTRQP